MEVGKGILISGAVLFALAFPMAFFIGGMATDDPYGPWWAYWAGFFYIEGIPTLIMLIGLIIIAIIKWRKRKITIDNKLN
ncbi:hypothetical protein V7056_16105 [Bacillus sp. JJ664]